MTKQQYRLLALTALMSATFALPVLAEEGGPDRQGERDQKRQEHYMKADTNKDGFLTKDEMLAQHKKRLDEMFEKSDLNKDGKLSKDEMQKGREAMRAKMKNRMKEWKDKRGNQMEDRPNSGHHESDIEKSDGHE